VDRTHARRPLVPAVALTAALAVAAPARADELVPIVQPGQPMRFGTAEEAAQVAADAAPVPPDPPRTPNGGASCLIANPLLDRRTVASSRCLACHDRHGGSSAAGAHPVDVAYARPSRTSLRSGPETFNAAIVLQGGKVGCLTCHDPKAATLHHLAAPTRGEVAKRLCVACHPLS